MARIAIVTDSTADLPTSMYRERDIVVVPLTVHFGEETYTDQVDLTSKQFFEKLQKSPIMPRTSQPSPADFIAVYERLLGSYDHIFSLHISSKLSGTYQSAKIAAETLKSPAIEVVDTMTVSLCTGLVTLAAADARDVHNDPEEVRRAVRHVMDTFGLLFTVGTLLYLEKNGRIGKAAALLGGLLSIRPILSMSEGELTAVERVRGQGRVLPRVLEIMESRVDRSHPVDVAVLHAVDPQRGEEWMEAVRERFTCRRIFLTECGPVVGTHSGPGALAVGWYPSIHQ
ncbi:MAG: DegV family protein [Firmicutes bacterium]|jgi:DegV family protein with EDD domain|nr:DegV family protein [Bacillota bacterium]